MAYDWPSDNLTVKEKIGIGTETPSERLEVKGNIKLNTGVAINKFSNDGTFAGDSDLAAPTEKAVKTYVDIQMTQVNTSLATKASLNGSTSQDFQTNNLTVAGNLQVTTFQGDSVNLLKSLTVFSSSKKPAIQLFTIEGARGYLALLNQKDQQSIQFDTTGDAGSIRIKNTEDKGIGAFQASDEGAGLLRLYNKTGERATIELSANQGESGVIKLFGADARFLVMKDTVGDSSASISSDGDIVANQLVARGTIFSNVHIQAEGTIFAGEIQAKGTIFADGNVQAKGTIFADGNVQAKGTIFADGNVQAKGTIFADGNVQANQLVARGTISSDVHVQAKGTIFADGNVQAKGTIFADGNVQAKGTIFADGNVQANQLVARGTISSDVHVQAKGTIFADGNVQAKGQIIADGDIFGKAKHFVIDHPNDSAKNIIYTAIEGPEAAAYIRGKSLLIDGYAEIEFPEHFSLVVNPQTITIQLTPCSAESKGLAVVSHSERGFSVRELWQGKSNYKFDYFVAGVRQGLEHFTPVVDKGLTAFGEPMGGAVPESPAARQLVSMMEEIVSPLSDQPVGSLSSPALQASSSIEPSPAPSIQSQAERAEGAMSEMPISTTISVPSPPAINFADKQPQSFDPTK